MDEGNLNSKEAELLAEAQKGSEAQPGAVAENTPAAEPINQPADQQVNEPPSQPEDLAQLMALQQVRAGSEKKQGRKKFLILVAVLAVIIVVGIVLTIQNVSVKN